CDLFCVRDLGSLHKLAYVTEPLRGRFHPRLPWPALVYRSNHETAIVPAEPETIGDGLANPHFAWRVGHVVQVAAGVGRLVVNGWMDHTLLNSQGGNNRLNAAARPEGVADHAFRAIYGQTPGVTTKDLLDRLGLGLVTPRSAGAVRVDVLNILGVETSIA